MASPGHEEIPLDLEGVPTIEAGVERAAEMDRQLTELGKTSMTHGDGQTMLVSHLPFLGVLNRAISLHRGIVSAIQQSNPHVAFTLIRSYLELVALVYTIGNDPSYLERLDRPPEQLPPEKRPRSIGKLIGAAGRDMPGIARVYYNLSDEIAHFGATAIYQAFSLTDEGVLRYGTAPHWKHDDEPRVALAMLLENDEAMLFLLNEWVDGLLAPALGRVAKAQEEGTDPDP